MRPKGEIYFPIDENKGVRTAKRIDGKRYRYQRIYLSKPAAEGAAAAYRDRGYLARVIPRMVWTKKRGVAYGYDKVQGYVLYVHITATGCKCGSGKSTFTFEGRQYCSDCAPLYVGD